MDSGHVNRGRQVDRSTGEQVRNTMVMVRLIGLSTMVRLIGPESNKGVQDIMDMRYLFIYRPVNLSTRVDRSKCKHIISRHYG